MGKTYTKFLFIFIILNFSFVFCIAQSTKIRGIVIDGNTKEPLPFVTISFKNTNIGCITDVNGSYFLESRTATDSIIVACVGYITMRFAINKNTFQTIDVKLLPKDNQLQEVVVVPGENPAVRIFRNMIKNKEINNNDKLGSYKYEIYNKVEFDVTNIDEKFKNQRVFKQFQFIFDYVDTSVVSGKSYLPVFITETLSDYYFQNSPKKEKEIIKANKVSGIESQGIAQYTGKMYQNANFYDNFIDLFGKQFVSPFASFGLLTYKYYLIDSSFIDNQWCFLISYKPKRKQELTFTGEFWVHDTTFAIKKIKARIADDANINYVNDLILSIEYQRINKKSWFVKKEELFVDFNITEKTKGVFGRKTTSYKNIEIEPTLPRNFFSTQMPQETIVLENATKIDSAFWNSARHEKLSTKEENIYAMVDSVKNVPIFNTFYDVINLLIGGYYVKGNFEYGPYFKTFSFNPIEGNRFRVGGRTSNNFSTNVLYQGHLAYGTYDERFKYGIGFTYMFSKAPRVSAGFYHKYDIEQLGQSSNAFTEDNLLSSLLSRNPNDNLLMVKEFKGFYEKEWFPGFSNIITTSHRQIFPTDVIQFKKTDGQTLNKLTSLELSLNTRFAYNEKFIEGEFERSSLGSEYPVININFTAGLKNILNSNYSYLKTNVNIQHHFYMNPFGYFKYSLEAGKVWGQIPFPFLKLHEGNETYALDTYAFNMMNYYEFASDTYLSLFAEHHFQGLFLNKIPLLRKLKWREVLYGKGLIGSLSDDNNQKIMNFPKSLSDVRKPYYEVGVGIENIFKLVRIDAIWRLSYLDHKNIEMFGLRAKVQLIF